VGPEALSYEGQAAIELEALASPAFQEVGDGYRFARSIGPAGVCLDPAPLWDALFADLARGQSRAWIAAAFHRGFASAVGALARDLARDRSLATVVLSGGVLQNRLILESLVGDLRAAGLTVLLQQQVPANDGGLSLGQASIAAARLLAGD
jgi:hydrogenase maturation protein HypF